MSFNQWEEVKLRDLISSVAETYKRKSEKVVLVNTSDVLKGTVLNRNYVDNKNLKGQFKKTFQRDDILYSEIRPQNKRFAYIDFDPQNYIASTKLMVLRRKSDRICNKYLFQILKSDSFISVLQNLAETRSGTFPQITFTELGLQTIMLPTLKEQIEIAKILSTLDEKIEVNNMLNKTLGNMAQEIFKRWYVDFEFPNEEGEPYKSSGGEMVESELGLIPEGWVVYELKNLFKFVKGKKPSIIESCRFENSEKYLTIDVLNRNSELYCNIDKMVHVSNDDILMVMDGASSGAIFYGQKGIVGSTLSKLEKTNAIISRSTLYNLIKFYEKEIKNHTTGSAIPHADKEYIYKLKVVLPTQKDIIKKIDDIFDNVVKKNIFFEDENYILKLMRDTLLPKLMSGEIRVPMEES